MFGSTKRLNRKGGTDSSGVLHGSRVSLPDLHQQQQKQQQQQQNKPNYVKLRTARTGEW